MHEILRGVDTVRLLASLICISRHSENRVNQNLRNAQLSPPENWPE
jgi:hypothetical protein